MDVCLAHECAQNVADDAVKTQHFARLLNGLFADCEDLGLLRVASETFGRLVESGGSMTSDIVEREVQRCVPWLNPRLEPSEARRYAAVLILKQLADNAPAVFNVHVRPFIDNIWGAIRDPKVCVRARPCVWRVARGCQKVPCWLVDPM